MTDKIIWGCQNIVIFITSLMVYDIFAAKVYYFVKFFFHAGGGGVEEDKAAGQEGVGVRSVQGGNPR